MTTTLDIITSGYRESNLIGILATPSAAEQAQGLELLQDILSSVLGYQVGERLNDWLVGTVNYQDVPLGWQEDRWQWPRINSRLVINIAAPTSVNLPTMPDDGARFAAIDILGNLATYPVTLQGNGRNIEGASTLVLDTDGFNASWIYRADLGNWVREMNITLDGDMPYPREFDGFFKTKLAMRVNPRYGRTMAQESIAELDSMQEKLRARYRQRVVTPADIGSRVLGVQVYNAGLGYGRGSGRFPWMS